MNNITYITDGNLFKPGNISAMRHAIRLSGIANASTQALFSATQYLPSLVGNQNIAARRLVELETRVREIATVMPISLDVSLRSFEQLQKEQINANDADLQEIAEDLESEMTAIRSTIKHQAEQLNAALAPVAHALDRLTTNGYLGTFESDNQFQRKQIEATQAQITALRASRDEVSSAINLIQSPDFASIANDTLLTAENLLKSGMDAPQTAKVEAAIEVIRKLIGEAEKGFTLLNLIEQRDSMTNRLSTFTRDVRALEDQTAANERFIELIKGVYQFDECRGQAVAEATNVLATLDNVLVHAGRLDVKEGAKLEEIIQTLRALAHYVGGLS
ncbi:alpha-xenorhabdolysin family binary toxin subunit B [Pseudomonas sp. LP_7_YM]|uniref:alpha-xenorhabdolysin family binary toxin subunit B n=1 Tax=Pseudomonas sp. LP_7_YM TaxID=2485137 RepID=UPI00105CCEF2|nr:alpha-xenorhabdolysin family binary toxin subunit B [Pseudomonas sp. LP_7_YM]